MTSSLETSDMRSDVTIEDAGCSVRALSKLSEQGVGQLILHVCNFCAYAGYNDEDGVTIATNDNGCVALSNLHGISTVCGRPTPTELPNFVLTDL